ncbi:DUF5615 family PIN-like protein [Saliphagus infecundisoli]|uniref:DUF5615 family PIN-like protein n=1 Tax=Saliphagus infecundisoli TaxID=1849069 RepID=A0ABD5QAT5_9EURY
MRLCCDENIKRSIYSLLEQEGYEVVRVQDELTLGDDDSEVIEYCRAEQRVLLTNDDDFLRSIPIRESSFWTTKRHLHATSSLRSGESRDLSASIR